MKKFLNIIKRYKFLLIALAIIIFVGQKLLDKDTGTTPDQTLTSQVQKGNIISSISTSGQVAAANYLAITTSVNGIVNKVYVTEGTEVKKGQKIMDITLDSEGERSYQDAYSSYLRAKNNLDSAKNSLYSLETMMIQKEEEFEDEKESNSYQSDDERNLYKYAENAYISAKNSYEIQKSSITQAQIALSSAYSEYQAYSPSILATADGIIANIVATEGTQIENSVTSDRSVQTIASIKLEGTPTVKLNVTELDINSIKVGQKVKLTLSSIDGKVFDGIVSGIDKIGTQSSGVANYPVIIKFDADDSRVLPNMSVTAEIIVESHAGVLYIPTGAVNTSKDGKYAMVIGQDGQQQKMDIKTGISDGTNTEVLEGLNEGDLVLVNTLPTEGFNSTSGGNARPGEFRMMGL
ncbi:MAG: efflux RND transporter periplasmic adaptor subunit [Patescibacteria group bacterium]|jgi:macrolide-specific efflux system membrane fusion protein